MLFFRYKTEGGWRTSIKFQLNVDNFLNKKMYLRPLESY